MDDRYRRMRETSPDRARVCTKQTRLKPEPPPALRKIQIIYYLARNGHLEHPHFMEVTHLANHHLRLKDVIDRLTALRGKGMPLMYAWSSKRNYKNGYVWNDLSENDIIYPAEGAEIVLKGSEIIEGCSERFEQLRVVNDQVLMREPNIHSKRCVEINLNTSRNRCRSYSDQDYGQEVEITQNGDEEEEEECEYEEKTSSASSTTHSRFSRGVSTNELEENEHEPINNKAPTESTPNNNNNMIIKTSSPPSTTRFSNSVLLQLISCGSSGFARPTHQSVPSLKASGVGSNNDLRVGVLCKNAVEKADCHQESGDHNDDKVMIKYMSENPRFGNMQSVEKEYFSGSIVESVVSEDRVGGEIVPVLKKSNSYNEERSKKVGSSEAIAEEENGEKPAKLKCIPRRKLSSKTTNK